MPKLVYSTMSSFRRKNLPSFFFDFRQVILFAPHLGARVQSLDLNGYVRTGFLGFSHEEAYARLPMSTLESFLRELPQLQHLSLRGLIFVGLPRPMPPLNNHLKQLNTLTIQNIYTDTLQTFHVLTDVLRLFSSIKTCEIASIVYYSCHSPEHTDHFTFPEHVKVSSLRIGPSYGTSCLEGVFNGLSKSHSFLKSISSLAVDFLEFHGIDVFAEFFQAVGPRLRSLRLDLTDLCITPQSGT